MGLDVTLSKCPNWEDSLAKQSAYEEKSEAIWDEIRAGRKYEDMTEEEKETARVRTQELEERMGLNKYGESPDIETIENNHPDYPEHYFKIGYLRSSYNSGGINSVLRRMGVPDLYAIFGLSFGDTPYYIKPDWAAALDRCKNAIEQYKVAKDSPIGAYDCFDQSHNPFMSTEGLPDSEEKALEIFKKELERREESAKKVKRPKMDWYSNREGQFMFPNIQITGLINGIKYGQPTVFVIYKPKKSKGGDDFYLQALEITRDTIQFVLDQPDADTYRLAWSA
jgi:hypothetical protein